MVDGWAVAGVVGGGIGAASGVASVIVSAIARRDSSRSAQAAVESAELARVERGRAVERTDVEWRREEREHERGIVILRNIGSSTAYSVTVVLTINGHRVDLNPGDVEPDGTIEHDATADYNAAARHAQDRMRNAPAGVFIAATTRFRVSARITWQSEHGTPDVRVIREEDRPERVR